MRIQVSDIRLLQSQLKKRGFYTDEIDGLRGPATDAAVSRALQLRHDKLPEGWDDWDGHRRIVALVQIVCHERDIDAGAIDGLYGPTTEHAADLLRTLITTGSLPRPFVDIRPIKINPHDFPLQTEHDLDEAYGKRRRDLLSKVRCPWTLTLDWDPAATTNTISIHRSLAESLALILESAFDHYGLDGINEHGLNRYGGSYANRRMRGGTSWSTHAWGIAVDWYPSRNKLKWRSDRASLADPGLDPWWELWEKEGWVSLGRTEDRDWMHVQAAKR